VSSGVVNVGGVDLAAAFPAAGRLTPRGEEGGVTQEYVSSQYPHVGRGTEMVGGSMDDVSRQALSPDAPAAVSSVWDAGVFEAGQESNVERW